MSATETLTVDLPGEYASFVGKLVTEGGYASPTEVVCQGLDTLREQDEAIELWLREEVVATYDRVKSGQEPTRPASEVFSALWKHHEQSKQAQQAAGQGQVQDLASRL